MLFFVTKLQTKHIILVLVCSCVLLKIKIEPVILYINIVSVLMCHNMNSALVLYQGSDATKLIITTHLPILFALNIWLFSAVLLLLDDFTIWSQVAVLFSSNE